MFKDIMGNSRVKLGLHTHTTRSDGHKTPEEAAALYKAAGYDAIAITDHWCYGEEQELSGLKILSGGEYNIDNGGDSHKGVYHILGLMTEKDPEIPREWQPGGWATDLHAAETVKKIKAAGGIAVLAHPAWSLNSTRQMLAAGDYDAAEIYNTVSEWGMSDRPDSGVLTDAFASATGRLPLLFASDDAHYYSDTDRDNCAASIMVRCESTDTALLKKAILAGDFYATLGPEVHVIREGNTFRVRTGPVSKIVFFTAAVWIPGRVVRGEGLCEASITLNPERDHYLRVEVTDADGKKGWSNYFRL